MGNNIEAIIVVSITAPYDLKNRNFVIKNIV